MTAPAAYAAADTSPFQVWRIEQIDTLRLAIPLALTQLGQITMMTTDLILIGRLGDQAIAAAGLGHAILFTVFMLGLGLVAAVAPLSAQAFGARNPRMVRRALRVGLWAAVLVGIPLTAGLLHTERALLLLGQTPELSALAGRYLDGMAWSMTPAWLFIALRGFMSALNRPQPALWITLGAIPANALLAYVLIYGAAGMPQLGILGAGIATTIVSCGMLLAGIWVCYTRRPFKKFHVLGRFWRADWALLRKLTLMGLPISAAFVLEHGLFAGATLIMGLLGTSELAAHQIALQIAAVVFMVPLGISLAGTVRVGHAVGRGDSPGTRRAGHAAISIGAFFQAVMAVIVIAARDKIPYLFLGDEATPATVSMATTLLLIGALFFIADGLQSVAAGALRGLNDTFIPFLFSAFGFWLVGFNCAYALAFPLGYGAPGIWIGLLTGLTVYAGLLIWRFEVLTRRGYLPSPDKMSLI